MKVKSHVVSVHRSVCKYPTFWWIQQDQTSPRSVVSIHGLVLNWRSFLPSSSRVRWQRSRGCQLSSIFCVAWVGGGVVPSVCVFG